MEFSKQVEEVLRKSNSEGRAESKFGGNYY